MCHSVNFDTDLSFVAFLFLWIFSISVIAKKAHNLKSLMIRQLAVYKTVKVN